VSGRTLHIFDESIEVKQYNETSHISVHDERDNVIYIYDRGKRGEVGPQGPPGYSGVTEPFYVITPGSLYGVTASLAIFGQFSSSLNPFTGSSYFDIGSNKAPWQNLFLTGSIYISNTPVIQRVTTDQQRFMIISASITASEVNGNGVFKTGNFNHLPPPVEGGIIKFGNDFFIGI
jgi:hypothetical protein